MAGGGTVMVSMNRWRGRWILFNISPSPCLLLLLLLLSLIDGFPVSFLSPGKRRYERREWSCGGRLAYIVIRGVSRPFILSLCCGALLNDGCTHLFSLFQCAQASATPLQRAAAEGHVDIVHQLLKHGADVNHQDAVVSVCVIPYATARPLNLKDTSSQRPTCSS